MGFKLQSDRIAVIADPLVTTTESGLHIPDTAQTNEPRYGTVAAVGIGRRAEYDGKFVPIDVAEGDRIFFHRGAGEVWKIEGAEYLVLGPREVIGVSDPETA